jgi:hypothetical protein
MGFEEEGEEGFICTGKCKPCANCEKSFHINGLGRNFVQFGLSTGAEPPENPFFVARQRQDLTRGGLVLYESTT